MNCRFKTTTSTLVFSHPPTPEFSESHPCTSLVTKSFYNFNHPTVSYAIILVLTIQPLLPFRKNCKIFSDHWVFDSITVFNSIDRFIRRCWWAPVKLSKRRLNHWNATCLTYISLNSGSDIGRANRSICPGSLGQGALNYQIMSEYIDSFYSLYNEQNSGFIAVKINKMSV